MLHNVITFLNRSSWDMKLLILICKTQKVDLCNQLFNDTVAWDLERNTWVSNTEENQMDCLMNSRALGFWRQPKKWEGKCHPPYTDERMKAGFVVVCGQKFSKHFQSGIADNVTQSLGSRVMRLTREIQRPAFYTFARFSQATHLPCLCISFFWNGSEKKCCL